MATPPSFSPATALRLIRPKQWIKNAFVFAPLIFARELFHPDLFLLALRAFVAFCFTASAVYIVNDFADLESDRTHPEKKFRPLAAGTIRPSHAWILFALLLILNASVVSGMNRRFLVLLVTYFVMNIAYSWKLR